MAANFSKPRTDIKTRTIVFVGLGAVSTALALSIFVSQGMSKGTSSSHIWTFIVSLLAGGLLGAIIAYLALRWDSHGHSWRGHDLGELQQRLYALLEVLPTSIYLVAPDHTIVFANRPFRERFGEHTDKKCYKILHDRDTPCPDCPASKISPTHGFVVDERSCVDGRTYEMYFVPFVDTEGSKYVLDMAIDITRRKKAQADKQEAERKLEEQRARAILVDRLRALGQMAADMAHELNQPLLGVRGLAEHILIALERGWELSHEKLREKIDLIIQQADRMSHVIEHALAFARGAESSEKIPVQVNHVIRSGIGLIGVQLQSKGIQLQLDLADDLPTVLANPFSLEEVILNLLTNARDALESKRKLNTGAVAIITLRATDKTDGDKGYVVIEVEDNGEGVPYEIIDKVFEPFFTTKEPDRGTGLGLSISRSIVEEFGGDIKIASAPGKGTRVTVTLPTA